MSMDGSPYPRGRSVAIPLPPATAPAVVVTIWFPPQLTRAQWSHLMTVLIAMRPGLVVEPDDAAEAESYKIAVRRQNVVGRDIPVPGPRDE